MEFKSDSCRPTLEPKIETLVIGSQTIPLHFIKHNRARRYVLRVRRDGSVRVTIPRGGSLSFGLEFARQNTAWLKQQLARRCAEAEALRPWTEGTQILFRGELVALSWKGDKDLRTLCFADQTIALPVMTPNFRPHVENHLWALADKELIPRTWQLAAQFQLVPQRVVVRNQRSRWGSCSPQRTISLNWRLIQAPAFVRDYLILHELAHLREMNHSDRFWRLVEAACPGYLKAESWLNQHSVLLSDHGQRTGHSDEL